MKLFLSILVCAFCISDSFAQINFYIDGQLVDNSQIYEYEVNSAPFDLDLFIENASNDTISLTVDFCQILDDPNWEMQHFIFVLQSDQFGGIGVCSSQWRPDSCWLMNPALARQFPPNPMDDAWFRSNFYFTAPGCETYRYFVLDNGVMLDSIDIKCCSVLGVDEIDKNAFKMYPNPTNSTLHVQSEKAITSIEVLDALGCIIQVYDLAELTSEITLDLAELEYGSYLVSVKGEKGEVSTQVVVIE